MESRVVLLERVSIQMDVRQVLVNPQEILLVSKETLRGERRRLGSGLGGTCRYFRKRSDGVVLRRRR